jgi:2-oxoisovalerate dehydrogenase E1 component alpha subunit
MSPTIETQYSTAIGTGIAQARHGGDGITIVNGGDAGTAEGDFHCCLVWANRPALKLPILIIVVNNGYGISTDFRSQHGEESISHFARPFDMPHRTVDGNDVAASWAAIREATAYVRKERKPYLLEAVTSRLHGHSSSSGAGRVDEPDCLPLFEKELTRRGYADSARLEAVWKAEKAACDAAYEQVRKEPYPQAGSIWEDVFSGPLPDSYPKKGGS